MSESVFSEDTSGGSASPPPQSQSPQEILLGGDVWGCDTELLPLSETV